MKSSSGLIDTSVKATSKGFNQTKQDPKNQEEEKDAPKKCRHGPTEKCLNCLGVTEDNWKDVKTKCDHGPDKKCPNCINEDEREFKHEPFDSFLTEMRKKCAKLHKPEAKCPNCTFSQEFNYKVDYNCKNHKPYPQGMCNKCIPANVCLSRQVYRHVDYCSVMNLPDLNSFVNRW